MIPGSHGSPSYLVGWKLLSVLKRPNKLFFPKTKKPSFVPRPRPTNPNLLVTPLKVHKLTRAEMDERQVKGLCYNCDKKYFSKHKCKEQKVLWPFQKIFLKRM
jgi:hypothetical protein